MWVNFAQHFVSIRKQCVTKVQRFKYETHCHSVCQNLPFPHRSLGYGRVSYRLPTIRETARVVVLCCRAHCSPPTPPLAVRDIMLALAVAFLVIPVNFAQRANVDTLQLAQVVSLTSIHLKSSHFFQVFRHGERAPVHYFNFPTDPPEVRTPFPVELAEMTNVEMNQIQ